MRKSLLIGLGGIAGLLFLAWLAAAPTGKVKTGDLVQPMKLVNIHGAEVSIPSVRAKWTHLQFRRFANCPICNLHMQSVVQRYPEIAAHGIQEVVVFHSPTGSLMQFQGKFPFDVIADPEKKLYAQFGVSSSIFSILDVRAWPAMVRGNSIEERPKGEAEGGPLGLPADFLIASDGRVAASHYGRYAFDQWSVDELLSLAK